ncbi:MAG: HAD-IC family P-type ATPase, partial [Solirubrobacteraceae bacterium]
LERISKINHIVFDKTGTLTENNKMEITYEGELLNNANKVLLKSIVKNSNHPLSRLLYDEFKENETVILQNWEEDLGKGLVASYKNDIYKLGSNKWLNKNDLSEDNKTKVLFVKNNEVIGKFIFKNIYRKGIQDMIRLISNEIKTSLLSGDSDSERAKLSTFFRENSIMLFNQNPEEKLNFINNFQQNKKDSIMMIGDGLNDAGALHVSDVGIALSDNINSFSPSCDVIMKSSLLKDFNTILHKINQSKKIIYVSLFISLLYNITGLLFAVTGNLNPLVAAILMPLSSISVVLFTTISTNSIFNTFRPKN